MSYKLQLVIDDDNGQTRVEDIIHIMKNAEAGSIGHCAGLSLQDLKSILKTLQQKLVMHEADIYTREHRSCPHCDKPRRIKGRDVIQYKTLFGIVSIPNLRLYHCKCSENKAHAKTLSLLHNWLPEHTSPELQYLETKWASHLAFDKTSKLLQDVLPIHASHNGNTVRNHLHKTAKRQEVELEDKPRCISGCGNDWAKLPKPDKPLTVGIDGGYVRSCTDKKTNFEIIIGKSFSKTKETKRFGFVQSEENQPERRLLDVLRKQGMQENQQITLLSDGADNVRSLQYLMHPESEHILDDWFHLTMRITVLRQFAKGLVKSAPKLGKEFQDNLVNIKWYLWHGNVRKAIELLEHCEDIFFCADELDDAENIIYRNKKKFVTHLEELHTYVENNRHLIPNYGERWRYGESISSSFVESTVNEVITKRMVKKQQMQWSHIGAYYLLQARNATLNGELEEYFERWYPGIRINGDQKTRVLD